MSSRTMVCIRRAGMLGAFILFFTSLGAEVLPPGFGVQLAFAQRDSIPSAVMLKRVAEAVDGYRSGTPVYVVAGWESPHYVLGVFERRQAALARAADSSQAYTVLGPYLSPKDPGMLHAWISKCVHDAYSSIMGISVCPERPMLRADDIRSVSITVRMKNDSTFVFPVADGADAIFMSLAAIDKFAIPYYTRILGVEAAAAMRRGIVANMTRP